MKTILGKTESMLAAGFVALVAAGVAAPPFAQSSSRHELADQRSFFGILNAVDVLSTVPFALAGFAVLWMLWRAPTRSVSNMQRAMGLLFAGGLILVTIGSAAYHLDPGDAGLATERYCLAAAFAGLLGLAAAGHVGERAGAALGLSMLAAGTASVKLWAATANVMPWAVLHYGGLVMLWWLATLPPTLPALPVSWGLVILMGIAAKLVSINDQPIFQLTGHMVSGRTLEHLMAALAAWPVICAMAVARERYRTENEVEIIKQGDSVQIRWSKA